MAPNTFHNVYNGYGTSIYVYIWHSNIILCCDLNSIHQTWTVCSFFCHYIVWFRWYHNYPEVNIQLIMLYGQIWLNVASPLMPHTPLYHTIRSSPHIYTPTIRMRFTDQHTITLLIVVSIPPAIQTTSQSSLFIDPRTTTESFRRHRRLPARQDADDALEAVQTWKMWHFGRWKVVDGTPSDACGHVALSS